MPRRCGCASDQCSCFIVAGENVTISGTGTQNDPVVVSAATKVVDESGTPIPEPTDTHWIGQIIEYAGTTPPSADYVACDGAALSRAVYATLFARIGTTYGAGDGSTTFNIPDERGKVSLGPSGSHAAGSSGGAETKVLTTGNLPPHAHVMTHGHTMDSGGTHDHPLRLSAASGGVNGNVPQGTGTNAAVSRGAIDDDGAHTHTINNFTGNTGNGPGSSTPVDTMPPYVAVPKYIRITGGL